MITKDDLIITAHVPPEPHHFLISVPVPDALITEISAALDERFPNKNTKAFIDSIKIKVIINE